MRFIFVRNDNGLITAQFASVDHLRAHGPFYARRPDGLLIASDTLDIADQSPVPFVERMAGVVACKNYCAIYGIPY